MAMSDTGSSFPQWSDDIYHYDIPSPGLSLGAMDGGGPTIAAASTGAAAAAPTSPASAGSADGSPNRAAGKPASAGRKRARTSRRAPVTMLNTDAANFRAMVQQFTGIPAPPAGPVINFGGVPNYGFHQHQPPAAAASVSFDHHQQQYAFGYGNGPQQQALAGDVFAHGLGSAQDRMLLQTMMPAANNSANGYFC
ncbi:unnamed protein product [Alopecurus aequalis]